ncbi:hypothetical protein [Micromonospora sp. NPDC049891]|uniref:hypothetical protein n=1 Tax=Micromonospora sp. NPDC049891 TaxID=3155655 RepID=UPI0033E661D5
MTDTWTSIDLPVLKAAVKYIEDRDYGEFPQAYDLAPLLDIDENEVGKAMLRLDGTYIEAFRTGGGLCRTGVRRIYPAARSAVGQWPTPEAVAERLLAALQAAADVESDTEKRSKLKQAAAFLGEGGRDLLVNVLAAAINRGMGVG